MHETFPKPSSLGVGASVGNSERRMQKIAGHVHLPLPRGFESNLGQKENVGLWVTLGPYPWGVSLVPWCFWGKRGLKENAAARKERVLRLN